MQKERVRVRVVACGECDACHRDDCGTCANCRSKLKFGGTGTLKKRCIRRVCSLREQPLQEADDCGMCAACLDKPRFGGPGIKRVGCL
eukprot:2875766-Prymnesium_polylepis.1